MGSVQRAMNTLIFTLGGSIGALSKGLSKKGKKPSADKEEKSETEKVGNSLGFTTDLSSDEATQRAFESANNAIVQKYNANLQRKNRIDDIARRTKREGKDVGGGK